MAALARASAWVARLARIITTFDPTAYLHETIRTVTQTFLGQVR